MQEEKKYVSPVSGVHEKKRKTFLMIGLITSISMSLIAFRWKFPERKPTLPELSAMHSDPEWDVPPVVRYIEPEKKKQEKEKTPSKKSDQIEVVSDDEPIADDKPIFEVPTDTFTFHVVIKKEEDVAEDLPLCFGCTEKQPRFPGGNEKIIPYINQHIRFPARDLEEANSGDVFIDFIVEKDGSISSVQVVGRRKKVSKQMEEEALRVIREMPRWEPGMMAGHPVRVRMTVPIKFVVRS